MMSKNSIVPFLKDYLIKFLTRPFLLDTNDLVIKYSIEDCLPLGGKGTFPVVSDRLDEIHALVNYAEIVVIYAIYALSLAVYWLLNINKK